MLQDGSTLSFDYLIVAAGAETNFFGVPGMREHGWPLYTPPSALEQAAAAGPAAAPINVVVAGGGSGAPSAT